MVDVFAAVLARAGELETGVRLHAAVTCHLERRGEERPRLLWRVREETYGELERALVSPDFADAAAEGRRMSLEEAVRLALAAARDVTSRLERAAR